VPRRPHGPRAPGHGPGPGAAALYQGGGRCQCLR
jgi:hypothetical protein